MDIEIVESYKYLGVDLNNTLDWTDNIDELQKKVHKRPEEMAVWVSRERTTEVRLNMLALRYHDLSLPVIQFWT